MRVSEGKKFNRLICLNNTELADWVLKCLEIGKEHYIKVQKASTEAHYSERWEKMCKTPCKNITFFINEYHSNAILIYLNDY